MTRDKLPESTVTGIYEATKRGFGFVIPEDPEDKGGDYFIPPKAEAGAWNGDRVVILPEQNGGSRGDRREGRVVQVLSRANRTVTGAIHRRGREVWLEPDSERLPGPIQVVGHASRAHDGDKVAISMSCFGSSKLPAMGSLREVFGKNGSRQAAVSAILYNHGICPEFPPEVLQEARRMPQEVTEEMLPGRLDLREKIIVTIDGAASKDLDDAVSLERDDRGRWVLGVHIADVSHYVTENSLLDREAWERGTSVYYADQVIPMLPRELSNGICSLNPGVDRLAMSCIMTLDAAGNTVEHKLAHSLIRSTERMTYEDCNLMLGEGQPELEARYAQVLPMLREMAELSKVLEARRAKRGSLALESSESAILCDEAGTPVEIVAREQGQSEKIIESFMLAANECVAEHMCRLDKPAVYRVHEEPSAEKAEALQTMVAPMGLTIPKVDHAHLQELLDKTRGTPEGPAVSIMVLRSMMKARYDTQNLGHFGLAAEYYCHFTSPIRRYPDLMTHRILSLLLEGKLEGQREQQLAEAAQQAAKQSSQREIEAQNAERDIEKCYMAEYMTGHLGEVYNASVSGVTKFGLFLMLPSGVEGLLPVEALPDDYYQYDEAHLTLVGERTGTKYTFGMGMEVQCVAADPGSGQIDFRLPGEDAPNPPVRREEKPAFEVPRKKRDNRRAVHVPKGRKPHKGGRGRRR